jgi:hypothetical protein
MFAEDVGLLPKRAFTELLESFLAPVGGPLAGRTPGADPIRADPIRADPIRADPIRADPIRADPIRAASGAPTGVTNPQFVPLLGALWREMDSGGFSVVLRRNLPRFNGKLFKQPHVLPLDRAQIAYLLEASRSDWTLVEPAIFGTLLERALNPLERHALGAHYTPRAYVERLVLPAVIEPLRGEWGNAKAAALVLAGEGKPDTARAELHGFHHRLCQVRVLDPACGSGNFLYVILEHMKRLEGEVLDLLDQLGDSQGRLEAEGLTVDPHQFLGLELNPRAAAIAELVLWIGYLQWHFRTRGNALPPSPILKDFRNIECRDAVLAYERMEYALDQAGKAVTRWDGRTTKVHPVTGEAVPDEAAQTPLERYVEPRRAEWPEADYVVGNPPFIGASTMRAALGDGYVEALRGVWQEVPESADFVMYWWHHAAHLVREGRIRRFGFITTNSVRQTFNRRLLESAMDGGLTLLFAIPDHPWVDEALGAAVRIAMTVGAAGQGEGRLLTVTSESPNGGEGLDVRLAEKTGVIHADLSIGADVAGAGPLAANAGISPPGFKLHGAGFIVTPEQAAALCAGELIRPYRSGRDLTDKPRRVMVIGAFGLTESELRQRHPAVWQWLAERVKPERNHNARAGYRENWWLFGEPRRDLRAGLAGLPRYIASVETAKHRVFQSRFARERASYHAGRQAPLARQPPRTGRRRRRRAAVRPGSAERSQNRRPLQRQGRLEEAPAATPGNPGRPGPGAAGGDKLSA